MYCDPWVADTFMMTMELLSTSIVVAAEQHNPTILHFSFLKSEGIVPEDWKPKEDNAISTPALSVVEFLNRVVFQVDSDKLVITQNGPASAADTLLADLAAGYVRKLPHVHYKALGVNAASFAECSEPDRTLLERFLKQGVWSENGLRPVSIGLQMTYPTSVGKLRVSLKPVKLKAVGFPQQREGILVETNCHVDTSTVDATLAAIEQYSEKVKKSLSIASRVVEAELKG